MTRNNASTRTILVVDDYADTRRVVRWMLERQGYRVVEAEGGAEAIEVAARERPALVLMDLSMPQTDGFDATRSIHESEGLAGVPVIAMTAHDMLQFRDRAEETGFDYYITKPIDFQRLAVLVEKLLGRGPAARGQAPAGRAGESPSS
ncbi:MAG TPA: response regulator [Pyrinomonadaceae bacterium]|nr:response regulator [Pyrinomonadaceae bacterium]